VTHRREGVGARLAGGVDRAFHAVAIARSRRAIARSRAESLGPGEREEALLRLREIYDREDLIAEPSAFFQEVTRPVAQRRRVRRFGRRGEVVDVTWPSDYHPFLDAVADGYLREEANRTAGARLVLHRDGPRPAVILVHGYLAGPYVLEERAWPLRWLFEWGLDCALVVLPFHAFRSGGRRPRFPSSDPRLTIEGFRQAILDVGTLAGLLEARGAPAIGLMGMSLGGYTTALAATVDPRFRFAVPWLPLASIADFAREGGRFVGTEAEQARQHELLETVHRVVSPLARPPLVPAEGRLVVAARGDRITPVSHARRLAEHFDAPLELFEGGHLLQLGRGRGFRAVGRMLGRLGLFDDREHGL